MVDILNDTPVTLTEASQLLPGRPHTATLWRWYKKGVRGIKLETAVVGGVRYTTREALQRFIEATTAAHDGGAATPTVPIHETLRRRQAAIRKAERELTEAGI